MHCLNGGQALPCSGLQALYSEHSEVQLGKQDRHNNSWALCQGEKIFPASAAREVFHTMISVYQGLCHGKCSVVAGVARIWRVSVICSRTNQRFFNPNGWHQPTQRNSEFLVRMRKYVAFSRRTSPSVRVVGEGWGFDWFEQNLDVNQNWEQELKRVVEGGREKKEPLIQSNLLSHH